MIRVSIVCDECGAVFHTDTKTRLDARAKAQECGWECAGFDRLDFCPRCRPRR